MKIHGNNPHGGGPPSTPPGGGPDKARGHQHQEQKNFDSVFDEIIKEQEREREVRQEFEQRRIIEEEAKKKSQNKKTGEESLRSREFTARKKEVSETKSEDVAEAEQEVQDTETPDQKGKIYKQLYADKEAPVEKSDQNETAEFAEGAGEAPKPPDSNKLERKAGQSLNQEQELPQQTRQAQGEARKIEQKIEGEPAAEPALGQELQPKEFKAQTKPEGEPKVKEEAIGKSNIDTKDTGQGPKKPEGGEQKTGLDKAFSKLLENQETKTSQGGEANPGLDRAMNKLQERLAEGEGLPQTEAAENPEIEKVAKTFSDQKIERTDIPLGQTLPLSSYLEAAGKPQDVQAPVPGALNVSQIEKLVDQMMVGVNATGDPEIKMSLHVPELGQVEVKITRGDEGMLINFNMQNQKAGIQLGQNITALQESLIQRGLQINNIQLLVQNQQIPISELLDSFRPNADSKVLRKDASGRASGDNKKGRAQGAPPPAKGR